MIIGHVAGVRWGHRRLQGRHTRLDLREAVLDRPVRIEHCQGILHEGEEDSGAPVEKEEQAAGRPRQTDAPTHSLMHVHIH